MQSEPAVHVVDDDESVRDSLQFLLSSVDIPATTYASAQAFLDVAEGVRGCVVTDIRMPDIDGLELVRRLKGRGIELPVIVITGHGDVPLAVEAMKSGVSDFIEKPFAEDAILHAVQQALQSGVAAIAQQAERNDILERKRSLSQREAQVLEGLVRGSANKVIALDLDISPRTVEIYRAHVMTKMGARSLSDLVRMVMTAGAG